MSVSFAAVSFELLISPNYSVCREMNRETDSDGDTSLLAYILSLIDTHTTQVSRTLGGYWH